MYQIPEGQPKIQQESDFFLVKADTYKVAYPQNSGYNISRKYEKDINYKNDIAALYRRKESENLDMFQYFSREVNIIIDEQLERADI